MKRTILLLLVVLPLTSIAGKFNFYFSKGQFIIAQFTDIHWDDNSDNSQKSAEIINDVLTKEHPDIAVITGDVVTAQPAVKGWEDVIDIFEKAKTPFIVSLGNHDAELISKDSIFMLLQRSPYYAGGRGPYLDSSAGNCSIPIHSTDSSNTALLYFIDTNGSNPKKEYGAYDYIHYDETEWYRHESDTYTKNNKGKPLPALCFMHIPLMEYNELQKSNNYFGSFKEETISSSNINSGFFASILDKGDIMGVFCGHDHNNDFIGQHFGVALAYGRVSGLDAYGELKRGGRIIRLFEGKRCFETYVRTLDGVGESYYYPSGITSLDEKSMTYLKNSNVPYNKMKNGVNYTYIIGQFKNTSQINSGKVISKGILHNFLINSAPDKDHFAYQFTSFINVSKNGVYIFYTYSDDGSRLYIDEHLVVDNDGSHSGKREMGKVALCAGFHRIRVDYFEDYMGQTLEVGYLSRDIEETNIPDNVLFINKQ
jgi:hypothetical protein